MSTTIGNLRNVDDNGLMVHWYKDENTVTVSKTVWSENEYGWETFKTHLAWKGPTNDFRKLMRQCVAAVGLDDVLEEHATNIEQSE